MKKIIASLFCCTLLLGYAPAQDKKDPVLLNFAGKDVSKSEFEKIYRKNNTKDAAFDKKTIEDYLELFINYKLKVREAEEMGIDTTASFKNELAGYKKQLSQPYLADKDITDKILREAYERMKTDVKASHILVKLSPDALPRDTVKAYNRIMKMREMIVKGADFAKLAKDSSEDLSAKENGGDLGYFTALQMVYPFESAAFNAKKGELSMPVRTRFGYHIIKVSDSRQAQGEIHVAHIMVKTPANAPDSVASKAKSRIDDIYKQLQGGGNFEELAKQLSDDQNTSRNGGALPWFGTGRMVPEFEKAAFALQKDGDISAPVKSAYGWHIIKRLEKKGLASFEDLQSDLKAKIAKDSRSEISRSSMVSRIKNDYKFKEFPKSKEEFYKVVDSTLAMGTWDKEKAKSLNKDMFTLLDKNFTQEDFAKFMADHQIRKKNASPVAVVNSLYEQFVSESCISFKESRLYTENPDFKALMDEYRDGILLFELTDRKVWSRAVKDTMGLKDYYEKNKNNYMWNQRLDAAIYTCANADVAKEVRKYIKKGLPGDTIVSKINGKDSLSKSNLILNEGRFSFGDNSVVDSVKWEPGVSPDMPMGKSVAIVNVKSVMQPQPKTLEESRGLVTADYQAFLEKDWIETLRKKYPVTVNKEVLSTISR